jgi:hypothetical protein
MLKRIDEMIEYTKRLIKKNNQFKGGYEAILPDLEKLKKIKVRRKKLLKELSKNKLRNDVEGI